MPDFLMMPIFVSQTNLGWGGAAQLGFGHLKDDDFLANGPTEPKKEEEGSKATKTSQTNLVLCHFFYYLAGVKNTIKQLTYLVNLLFFF